MCWFCVKCLKVVLLRMMWNPPKIPSIDRGRGFTTKFVMWLYKIDQMNSGTFCQTVAVFFNFTIHVSCNISNFLFFYLSNSFGSCVWPMVCTFFVCVKYILFGNVYNIMYLYRFHNGFGGLASCAPFLYKTT